MIRSKLEAIETPLTEVLTGEGALLDRDLFGSTVFESRFPARGFSLSLFLHLSVAISTPLIPYLFPEKLNLDARKYRVKIVDFRIPTPLFYTPPEPPAPKKSAASRPKRLRIEQPAGAAARLEAPPAASAAARSLPKLELPVSRRTRSKDVILQPDQPPNIAVTKIQPLPSTFLWAQQPAPIDISRLIGAPRQPERPTFTLPQAQPKVQRPNQELLISDLQIGSAPVMTSRPPQLPVPPANVSPVSVPVYKPTVSRGELPSTVLPEGPPINLISVMERPAPPAAGYLLELGNRLAEVTPPADPNGQPDAAATDPARGSSVAAPDRPGDAGIRGTHADILSAGSQSGALSGSISGFASGESDKVRGSDTRNQPARGYPTGHLGVVIVRPSSDETGLEGADALSGQPVYTVFFDVPGSVRRWILQYCVTGAESKPLTRHPDGAFRIVPKRSVQPPYPIDRTGVNLKAPGAASRIVVFAAINERGEPTGVRLIHGTGQPADDAALATLKRWSFRPAMRGGVPVAVEALFGIPLE